MDARWRWCWFILPMRRPFDTRAGCGFELVRGGHIATPEEERRLSERRRYRDLPFELQPVAQATLNDLDLEFLKRAICRRASLPISSLENQRTLHQQLASLRFATADTPPVPTVTGLLAIGKDPQQFIGGAYIQFLRFDGNGLADPIRDEKRIRGRM